MNKTPKKVLSIRLPDYLIESIGSTAKSLGMSTAALVEKLVDDGLNLHMDKLLADQQAKLDALKKSKKKEK